MAKFEITNPEALKLIEDFKSGVFFRPYLEKIKQYKNLIISVAIFFVLLIFVAIGKSLSQNVQKGEYVPPTLDVERQPTMIVQKSEYEFLKSEIFLFSSDLPDPVLPNLDNAIDLKQSEL